MSPSLSQMVRLGAFLLLPLTGCMADVGADPELGEQSAALSLLPDMPLPITPLVDPLGLGAIGGRPVTELIANDLEYARLFGHHTPRGVDYAAGDKVLVYSAGLKPTTGYEASLVSALATYDIE